MDESVSKKVDEFFSDFRLRNYSKGQVLILSGEGTDDVFYLVEGKVKQYDVSYRGDEVVLNVFKPPAFFPMSLAINKTPNPYIFEAETDIKVRRAPASKTVDFLKANPDVMFDLLSRLYRGMDGVLGRMAQLMAGGAGSRVVYELAIEAKRFGKNGKVDSRKLTITEKDLAARAGLSRETVSREIQKLKALGLVKIEGQSIVVKDIAALQKAIG